ncbi:hypothetical protein EJB05_09801, partial [Eragrostis curvula]
MYKLRCFAFLLVDAGVTCMPRALTPGGEYLTFVSLLRLTPTRPCTFESQMEFFAFPSQTCFSNSNRQRPLHFGPDVELVHAATVP